MNPYYESLRRSNELARLGLGLGGGYPYLGHGGLYNYGLYGGLRGLGGLYRPYSHLQTPVKVAPCKTDLSYVPSE